MAIALTEPVDGQELTDLLNVTLCGTFRRDPVGLRQVFEALCATYNVLSPVGVDFEDLTAQFVRLGHEDGLPSERIERKHLDAIRNSDFVWLFCPDGYVGTSAALEIGFANSIGIPVLTDARPMDEVLASMVTSVSHPAEAGLALAAQPGEGLAGLQDYYRRIARRRGWSEESPRDTLLLLTEELGELARAIRKATGLSRDGAYPEESVGRELADVQLYLLHLASALGVDLATAVTDKERVNALRHAAASSDAA